MLDHSRPMFPLLLAALVGCGGTSDPSIGVDAAGQSDADVDAPGALFVVRGECGELDVELTEDSASDFDNVVELDHPFSDDDRPLLSVGGQKILADGNEGGSSLLSEVFAYEVLNACEVATLLKTETEIEYVGPSKKTDFLVEIEGIRLGVSVTRAQTFPLGGDFTEQDAMTLLQGKLDDILESSANVAMDDAWEKQILAVMVYNAEHLASLEAALSALSPATRADTVVWLTVTDGPDDFIYQ